MPATVRPFDAEIAPAWELVPGVDGVPKASGVQVLLKRDAVFRRSLALIDIVAAYSALLFAVLAVGGATMLLRPADLLLAPFVVLLGKAFGLYDRDQALLRKTTFEEAPSILNLSVLYALAVWLAQSPLLDRSLARSQVLGLTVATFALMIVGRSLVRAGALHATPAERCIVLGTASDAVRIAEKLANSRGVKATVVGRVALRSEEGNPSVVASSNLGHLRSLARIIAAHNVERVIIAPDSQEGQAGKDSDRRHRNWARTRLRLLRLYALGRQTSSQWGAPERDDQEEILDAIRLIKALGVKVSVLPTVLEVVSSSSTFDDVDGITLLGLRQYGLSKSSEFLKRLMDVVGATICLVLLAPLLLYLAILIKLDTRGPVFFSQPRIGRRGESFKIIKFRSMVTDAEQIKKQLRDRNEAEGGLFKIGDDPRITRVGRLLRQASLDELPQLLNVLRGDMSLVGPRPLVPDEDALIEGWHRRRLAVKPGMTGLWQIFGSSRIPLTEMVKIDYLYGANWSIWIDLKILLRTVPYMLHRRGL